MFITSPINRGWKAKRVMLVGAGREASFDRDWPGSSRQPVRSRRDSAIQSLGFVLRPGLADPSGDIDIAGFLQGIAEGLTLAEFDGASYKTGDAALGAPARLTIVITDVPSDASPESMPRCESAVARATTASAAISRVN